MEQDGHWGEAEIRAFVRLVMEMRSAQKVYFHARTRERLRKAMDLERRVDAQLLEMANGGVQQTFF